MTKEDKIRAIKILENQKIRNGIILDICCDMVNDIEYIEDVDVLNNVDLSIEHLETQARYVRDKINECLDILNMK